jgi:histidinol-phosphate aminotransferase
MSGPVPGILRADAVRDRIASTVRADVRALSAYRVAKAEGLVKLDAMESPYPPSPALRQRLAARLADVAVNRYPDGPADAVKQALRKALPLGDDAGLIVGNGSDEIIQIITTAIAASGAVVLAPEPTFVMYRHNALVFNLRYVGVPLRADFSLDEPAMLAAIAAERPALVWLAYPNNPTGNRFAPGAIERILRAAPGLVVVDEAYYAYADDSFVGRVLEFDNLVVVRTVSKIGMAGLRLGYAVAHPAWIAELDKVRPPYNVNVLTQAAVPVLLESDELAGHAATIRRERARLFDALASLPGATAYPSETNFIVLRVADANASFRALLDAGILVKNLDGWHPLLADCLRITVGTPSQNDALVAVLSRTS